MRPPTGPLFKHMDQEYQMVLCESELQEIQIASGVDQMEKRIAELESLSERLGGVGWEKRLTLDECRKLLPKLEAKLKGGGE